MSGLKQIIQALKNATSLSSKLKTLPPTPQKLRTYNSLDETSSLSSHLTSTTIELPKESELNEDQELVLLDDIEKDCLLTMMEYYTYLITFTGEFYQNHAFIQKTQDMYQHLLEDRPIKRELLYEMAPELYTYTLLNKESPIPLPELYKNLGLKAEEKVKVLLQESENSKTLMTSTPSELKPYPLTPPKMSTQEDYRYRVRDFSIWDREDPRIQEIFSHPHYSPYEIHRRTTYIWEQIKETYLESSETLFALEDKLGSMGSVMSYIKLKQDSRTADEEKVIKGLDYIERLIQEQAEFVESVHEHHMKNVILPFPMPEWLQLQFTQSMKEMMETRHVKDLAKAVGIPDNSARMIKEIEIREQKARDAMILDERDRKQAINLINNSQEQVLVRRELNAKDEALIRKVNLLSDSIKIEKAPEFEPDFTKHYNPEELRFNDIKNRNKMLEVEELYVENLKKILFLNNAKPDEFGLDFWGEHLNINTQRLRNIFYNFSAFASDGKNVVGKLSFVEVEKKKEPFDEFKETLKRDLKREQER